jgi:hypothetical protein
MMECWGRINPLLQYSIIPSLQFPSSLHTHHLSQGVDDFN